MLSSWEQFSYQDDGFGNLLEHCGPWYHENPQAEVPQGMIRANYPGALMFFLGDLNPIPCQYPCTPKT